MRLLLTFKTVDGATFQQTTSEFPSAEAASEKLGEAICGATIGLADEARKYVLATRHIVSVAIEAS